MTNDFQRLVDYNTRDVIFTKRNADAEYSRWISSLKYRFGIFWKIPYLLNRGRMPHSNGVKWILLAIGAFIASFFTEVCQKLTSA